MKNLLFISNHQITTYGLELLLKSKTADVEVKTVADANAMSDLLAAENFQMLVTILEANTKEIAIKALNLCPNIFILAITNNTSMQNVQSLYKIGIKGIVDIANTSEVIIQASEEVLAGHTFMEEKFKNFLLQSPGSVAMFRTPLDVLTKREEEVIGLMLKGKKMGEISKTLELKPSTVSTFKTKIYEKLGVKSLLELQEVFSKHAVN